MTPLIFATSRGRGSWKIGSRTNRDKPIGINDSKGLRGEAAGFFLSRAVYSIVTSSVTSSPPDRRTHANAAPRRVAQGQGCVLLGAQAVPVKKFIWSERCDQCGCAASERAGTDQVQGRRERPAGKFINTTAASGAALLEIETPAFDDSRYLVRTQAPIHRPRRSTAAWRAPRLPLPGSDA